ncbi:hypothetical protein [Aeromicrobium choanae]|uniref:Uncharacterized protein n=1 Tax=Aeromicrobium choanae TaxID=1736691 RepID=A0A1T4YY75_9ACTN|nr:hypothetical protein [Aeromicrobium choanae]SKB06732.1 hypothetical protein SAMN06295964_1428 [Aeromicrobium choanae]
MKTWHLGAAAVLATAAAFLAAQAFMTHLSAGPDASRRGATALGTSADGTLLVRTQTCDGERSRGEVVISRNTSGRAGSDVVASFSAAPTISVDLGLPDPTSTATLLVRSVNTRAVRSSIPEWQAVPSGLWLVSEPGTAGPRNRTLTEKQFLLWAC